MKYNHSEENVKGKMIFLRRSHGLTMTGKVRKAAHRKRRLEGCVCFSLIARLFGLGSADFHLHLDGVGLADGRDFLVVGDGDFVFPAGFFDDGVSLGLPDADDAVSPGCDGFLIGFELFGFHRVAASMHTIYPVYITCTVGRGRPPVPECGRSRLWPLV